jgi:hypothetical protein
MALVRTDVSEEPGASFIRVTRIGELVHRFFIVTAVKASNLTQEECRLLGSYAVWLL